MISKKVILVICEGDTDETALGYFFKQLYNNEKVLIHVEHGDITSKKGMKSTNIVSSIGNIVKKHATTNRLKKTDYWEIIHLIDTDGAFIPPTNVVFGEKTPEPFYSLSQIITNNVKGIQARNQNKKENICRLISTNHIWSIPYKVFYMSCNLDHVLYNKPNNSPEGKENDSFSFFESYEENYSGFVDFLCNSNFSVKMNYKDSWTFICNGLNSLKRYTNLNICFSKSNDIDLDLQN